MADAYGILIPVVRKPKRRTFYVDLEGKIAFIDDEVDAGKAGDDVAARLKHLGVAVRS